MLVANPRFKNRSDPGETLACLQVLGRFNQLCLKQLMDQFRVVQPRLITEQVFVERAALGKGNYDRKVFNNIWGTFTFGPDNTVYLGAYRGFLRFWSDEEMPK